MAILDVHDELAGAVAGVAAAVAARQERLAPRRRLGLLVEVLGLLQLVLPRLRINNTRVRRYHFVKWSRDFIFHLIESFVTELVVEG